MPAAMPADAAAPATSATFEGADECPTPELDAIVAAMAGDRAAFARLYEAYHPTIRGVVVASIGIVDVSDVVQDIFAIALRRIAELRDATAFRGWLAAIARSRCIDTLRRQRPTEPVDEERWASGDPPRTDALVVLRAIRQLPPSYQETVVMRLVEGMSAAEIADYTGMTPGSVRVNLHRGLKLLREHLGIRGESDG